MMHTQEQRRSCLAALLMLLSCMQGSYVTLDGRMRLHRPHQADSRALFVTRELESMRAKQECRWNLARGPVRRKQTKLEQTAPTLISLPPKWRPLPQVLACEATSLSAAQKPARRDEPTKGLL
ncbi:hypothetical protein GGI42DRAFT_337728 [Trichoderma sp. SZMC 28013]